MGEFCNLRVTEADAMFIHIDGCGFMIRDTESSESSFLFARIFFNKNHLKTRMEI